jgi:hypothetical protein
VPSRRRRSKDPGKVKVQLAATLLISFRRDSILFTSLGHASISESQIQLRGTT